MINLSAFIFFIIISLLFFYTFIPTHAYTGYMPLSLDRLSWGFL